MKVNAYEILINYLGNDSNLLYEVLKTSYCWDLIDLFINDIEHPDHWKKIQELHLFASSMEKRVDLLIADLKRQLVFYNMIQKPDIIALVTTYIDDLSLYDSKKCFLQQTSRYILEEIRKENVSKEFLEFLIS